MTQGRASEKKAANKSVLGLQKKTVFEKEVPTIRSRQGNLSLGLASHSSRDKIKSASSFYGGNTATLKDGKWATYETNIAAKFAEHFENIEGNGDKVENDIEDTVECLNEML